jgi:hypothetical protein
MHQFTRDRLTPLHDAIFVALAACGLALLVLASWVLGW